MLRSIGSVVTGFALWTLLWLAGNAGLAAGLPDAFRADGSIESSGLLLVVLALSALFSIVAGYVTAAIARTARMKHAAALGLLLLAVGVFVQIQYWNVMPLWFHLPFLTLLIPAALGGGLLRILRGSRPVRPAAA